MYRLPRAAVKPGVTVRELVELRLAAGTFFKTDPNRYANELMSSIVDRKPTQATLELADGRVINVVNQPMDGGGWVVTHKDVTERWTAERELENTRNFLHTVIENVPATITVKDARTLAYVADQSRRRAVLRRRARADDRQAGGGYLLQGHGRDDRRARQASAREPQHAVHRRAPDRSAVRQRPPHHHDHAPADPRRRRQAHPPPHHDPGRHREEARGGADRAARALRLAHRPAEPDRVQSMLRGGAGAGGEVGRKLRGAVRRSRPLQGSQRRVRAFDRRSRCCARWRNA